MSDDLIKRSDAIKSLDNAWINGTGLLDANEAIKQLNDLPPADKLQGKWIPCTKGGLPLTELGRREGQKWYGYKCSKCNFIYKGNALTESPFCQNCGARMKGAEDD